MIMSGAGRISSEPAFLCGFWRYAAASGVDVEALLDIAAGKP
jgi:hypothetical protein